MKSILTAYLAISLSVCVASPQTAALAEASQHIKIGDYVGARTILEAILARTPQLPEAHNLLGVCLRELNDTTGAAAQFRLVTKLAPAYANGWLNLASTLASAHDEMGTVAALNELIRINPKSIDGHLALAKIKLARGEETAAVQQLETVIQIDPHNTFALANAGLIESRKGHLDRAAGYISRALTQDPQSKPLRLGLIELYLRLGRATDAAALCDESVHNASLTQAERATLATLLLNSGLTEKGMELVRDDSALTERFYDQAFAAAKQKLQANKPKDAGIILNAIRSIRPQDAELHHLLGLAWYQTGDTKKASDELQEAIRLDPSNPERYFPLGMVYLKHRTPALAQIIFEHGLAQAGDSARLWFWLGLSQYLGDDSTRAEGSVQKALAIDPGLVDGYVLLGDILESDGRLSEASDLFHRAIEKRPDLSIGYFYCGKVALENGEVQQEQALAFLTKAIELNPDFAEAHYEKGRALEQSGKLEQAVAEYKTSLTKNGALSQAHYRLALIYRKLGQARAADNELAQFEETKVIEKEKDSVLSRLEYQIRQP